MFQEWRHCPDKAYFAAQEEKVETGSEFINNYYLDRVIPIYLHIWNDFPQSISPL